MFITRNWLQRFIDIGNKGDPEIAEQLSKLGFETKKVYTVENVGCCMAKVKRVIPLSDNDRLFKYLLQIKAFLVNLTLPVIQVIF